MRSASQNLQDFLRTRTPCWIAELFTLTLADGVTQFLWTNFDRSLTSGGSTWIALSALIKRTRMSLRNTVEVPEIDVTIAALDSLTLQGLSLKTAVHNGLFDGATLLVQRAFMPTAGDLSLGPVVMFKGRISQSQITASSVQFTAKGDSVLMNQQTPRNLYQTTCAHTFCDAGCALAEANFSVADTVGANPTAIFIPWGSVPANPTLFILGKITFNGGVCLGQVRTVRNADATGVYLTYPLYGTPAPGDATTILMGCARTWNACQNHTDKNGNPVNNKQNFRGYPFVPNAEYGA